MFFLSLKSQGISKDLLVATMYLLYNQIVWNHMARQECNAVLFSGYLLRVTRNLSGVTCSVTT